MTTDNKPKPTSVPLSMPVYDAKLKKWRVISMAFVQDEKLPLLGLAPDTYDTDREALIAATLMNKALVDEYGKGKPKGLGGTN